MEHHDLHSACRNQAASTLHSCCMRRDTLMTAAYIAFVSLVLAARKVSPRGTSLSVSEGSHEGHERILNNLHAVTETAHSYVVFACLDYMGEFHCLEASSNQGC